MDNKGLFPASVDLTTDLHSMGQFIQDGSRVMFETVINIDTPREELTIGEEPVDLDGLNYLAGFALSNKSKSNRNGHEEACAGASQTITLYLFSKY